MIKYTYGLLIHWPGVQIPHGPPVNKAPFEYNKWTEKQCEWCGNNFPVRKKELTRGRGRFCSNSCSIQYVNTLKKPPKSNNRLHTIARNIYILRHGEPICKKCGSSPADVHHKNENIKDNTDKNHIPLCRSCHIKHHNTISPKRVCEDVNHD